MERAGRQRALVRGRPQLPAPAGLLVLLRLRSAADEISVPARISLVGLAARDRHAGLLVVADVEPAQGARRGPAAGRGASVPARDTPTPGRRVVHGQDGERGDPRAREPRAIPARSRRAAAAPAARLPDPG